MIKSKKTKRILIVGIIALSVLLLFLYINNRQNINEINKSIYLKEEPKELFSYVVYDNQDKEKNKILIYLNSEDGIEYFETPENKIFGNGKTKMSLDYEMKEDQDYIFKIKEIGKTEEQKVVKINTETLGDSTLGIELISSNNGYQIVRVKNLMDIDGFESYYKLGTGGNAIEKKGDGLVPFFDYDMVTGELVNSDNTITISARLENKNGNKVTTKKDFSINPSTQENTYTADSLIDAIKDNNNISNGLYKVNVANKQYNLKVITIENDLEVDGYTTIGSESDVATSTEYAKNMVVLNVKGNLTVKEGATLTSYTSKDGYGGPKGMFVYCSGTITNNGTIDNSHGAKAEGEDVYLFKNADGNYEYVPAVGAEGGAELEGHKNYNDSPAVNRNGNRGKNGVSRQTGGGGTGALIDGGGRAATGGKGTSYSGGVGTGGKNGDFVVRPSNDYGGKGGLSAVWSYSGTTVGTSDTTLGGAGNPMGDYNNKTGNGTGGLLIVYGNNIINNGNTQALGTGTVGGTAGGGASGGGSVNVFYSDTYLNTGTVSANGGVSKNARVTNGGAGGNGFATVGKIENGTFVSTTELSTLTVHYNDGTGRKYKVSNYKGSAYTVIIPDISSQCTGQFAFYSTASDGTGTKYMPNDTINMSDSLDIYAIWKEDLDDVDTWLACINNNNEQGYTKDNLNELFSNQTLMNQLLASTRAVKYLCNSTSIILPAYAQFIKDHESNYTYSRKGQYQAKVDGNNSNTISFGEGLYLIKNSGNVGSFKTNSISSDGIMTYKIDTNKYLCYLNNNATISWYAYQYGTVKYLYVDFCKLNKY